MTWTNVTCVSRQPSPVNSASICWARSRGFAASSRAQVTLCRAWARRSAATANLDGADLGIELVASGGEPAFGPAAAP
ncbi:hypothetical protein ACFLIM_33585 [Nonomuraea sp. M3C6]|uniref:Uncharacterized protein n=1 Tax=Nonomuraea marmarensis TaxID=3351344 RepID=A0ABW7AL85_9ACTN